MSIRSDVLDPAVTALPDRPDDATVEALAAMFGLLSDPHRVRLMAALLEGELCVSDLAAVCRSSESAVSHALRLLRAHQVVTVRRTGRRAYYSLADSHVRLLLDVALEHLGHADRPELTP